MKFFIKDEKNNTFEIYKVKENEYDTKYNLVNFYNNKTVEETRKDKILFNELLSSFNHINKVEVELFALFFSKENGYTIITKRDYNNTYIKIISKVEDRQDVSVSLTVYDKEFEALDFNEYFAYHVKLLSLLNSAFLKIIDCRYKFDFDLSNRKINAINKINKTSNLTIAQIVKYSDIIKYKGNDEDLYENEEGNYED